MDESYVVGVGLMRRLSPTFELHTNFMGAWSGPGKIDQTSARTGRLTGRFERRQSFVLQVAFVWDPAPDIW